MHRPKLPITWKYAATAQFGLRRGAKDGLARRCKGPLAQAPGTEEIEERSRERDGRGKGEFLECVDAIDEKKGKAGYGGERRQRIERHAEGARKIGLADAQQDYADLLKEKLQ